MANWQLGSNFFELSAEEQAEVLASNMAIEAENFQSELAYSQNLESSDQEEVLKIQKYVSENFAELEKEIEQENLGLVWGGRPQQKEGQSNSSPTKPESFSEDESESKVLHESLGTRERLALNGRIRHLISKIVLKGGDEAIQQGRILDVASSLEQKIASLLKECIGVHARPQDQAQMILWTDAMQNPISTPFRLVDDLAPEHLLTAIAKAQNSGATISFEDRLIIEFVHVKCDPTWGDVPEESGEGGRGALHLLYFGNQEKKRSVKVIADPGDNMCMARCLVLGAVHCRLMEARKKYGKTAQEIPGTRQEKNLPAEVESLSKAYKQMGRNRKNNSFLLAEVRKLYCNAGVPYGQIGDFEILRKFEAALGICVKVVSMKHKFQVIQKGEPTGDSMIYLLHTKDPVTKQGHYSLITNICGFFSKKFYCRTCDVSYNNRYDHRCPDVQNWCYSCYDRHCSPSSVGPFFATCKTCQASLHSANCQSNHLYMRCKDKWKCPRCKRKFPRKMTEDEAGRCKKQRHMTDLEMARAHDCSDHFCTECKCEVEDSHECFIAKKKLSPKLCKLLFYDFETDQSSGEHIVNFAHMKYFVRDEKDEEEEEEAKKLAKKEGEEFDDSHLSDHDNWKGEWKEASFKGETALHDFLKELSSAKFEGYTAIAHNMKGFDGLFVLRTFLINGVLPEVIMAGQKIMTMKVPSANIRFIDSFNFLPMGLAKLPGAFDLKSGAKGYFPHFFNSRENWDYVGPLPEKKFYGVDSMGSGEREKFLIWYKEQTELGAVFNFQKDLEEYCKQDVNILADSCLAYRKLMCLKTGCDPFAYLTCASVCNAVYNHNFMPENQIARVPAGGYPRARYSDEACEWLSYQAMFCGIDDLQHAGNAPTEKRIQNRFVDGFSESRQTVYEYYGCFYHGCRKCFPDDRMGLRTPDTQKLLSVCYEETMAREAELKALGYKVISIWGCEWAELKRNNPDLRDKVNSLELIAPLNPRDAFFGGRTECFQLHCIDVAMGYEDVTSLYPWVNFWMRYPVGHPKIITHDFKDLSEYFGLVKCTILPPQDLYLPVLPMHCGPTKKLIFALCRSCAERFSTAKCTHEKKERAITGTWFSEEVKLAVEKGFKVQKIHSVWHFEQQSDTLFRDYVKEFYKMKLLSSKLPFKTEDEIRSFMKEVLRREEIFIQSVSDFVENAGLRQLTKLMLNNLWGRYGMRLNMLKSEFIADYGPIVALLMNPLVEVQGIRVITEDVVQVIHRMKDTQYLPMANGTNIFVAVATTAWARIKLYRELDKLRERALYCDTDSVIYRRSENPAENLTTGAFLGDMTDELDADDCITEFVSGGPKNYGYRTQKGKVVVKVKGFTLNHVNSKAFSFDNIKNVVLNGVSVPSDFVDDEKGYGKCLDEKERNAKRVKRDENVEGSRGLKRKICENEPVERKRFKGDESESEDVSRGLKRKASDEDESVVKRLKLQSPKTRREHVERMREKMLAEHRGSDAWQSAIANEGAISVYNSNRIQRTRKFEVKRTPEQKIYSFCFDKRIILNNFVTIPYGYVGPLSWE